MSRNIRIKSVKVALDIIELLSKSGGESATEIARQLDIPVSTIYDYLQTLEELRYIVKENGGYHPSLTFLRYGEVERQRNPVMNVSKPKLEQLAEETGEWICLFVEEYGKGVLLSVEAGENAVEFHTYPGMSLYLHATAPGKSILAFLPDRQREQVFEQHGLPNVTRNTITDPEALQDELRDIRERNYATAYSESIGRVPKSSKVRLW